MPALPPHQQTSPTTVHAPARWSQEGIGQDWQHRFFYWLIRLGGKARGYHMALIVTFWYVLFYPSIRKRCSFYLTRRFPQRRGRIQRFLDTYRLVRTYGSSLVDSMVLQVLGKNAVPANCPDHDRLMQLSTGGRGFVLIQAHLGNWQVGVCTLGEFDGRVSIVMLPEQRTRNLVDPNAAAFIDPGVGLESAVQMTEALLRGDILVMMGDRTLQDEKNVVAVQFLGRPVLLPVTPYRLASATAVPVVVMTAPKIDGRRYELRLARVIEVPPGLGRNADAYTPYAQQFADCMEAFVREHPWQFYNFYDFWQNGSAG